jgi:hypothetical protein
MKNRPADIIPSISSEPRFCCPLLEIGVGFSGRERERERKRKREKLMNS